MRIDKVIRIKGNVNKKRYEEDPNSMVSQDQLLNNKEENKEKKLHILNRQMLTVYYSEILIERDSKSIYLARRKKKIPEGRNRQQETISKETSRIH